MNGKVAALTLLAMLFLPATSMANDTKTYTTKLGCMACHQGQSQTADQA